MGHHTRFIELAGEINTAMPKYVVDRVSRSLNEDGVALSKANILMIGLAYKKNVDDPRETPAAEIIDRLADMKCSLSYHDPHLPEFPEMRKYDFTMSSVPLTEDAVKNCDCVLIITDHDNVDYGLIAEHAKLVVDTRNALDRVPAAERKARIVKA